MLNGSGPSGAVHAAAGGGAVAGNAMMTLDRLMREEPVERSTTWLSARRKPGWRLSLTGAALVHVCLLVSMLMLPGAGYQLHPGLPEVVKVSLHAVEEPEPATPGVQSASHREAPPRPAPLVRRPRNNSPAAIPSPVATQSAKEAATSQPPQPVPAQPEGASPQALSGDAGFAKTGTAAAPNTEVATEIPARPRYRDNPPPLYPEQARRRRLEGTVVLEALVGGKGKVDKVTVHASSGHQLLDEAALRAVRDWLFEPGQRGGMPVTAKVLVPVRFALR